MPSCVVVCIDNPCAVMGVAADAWPACRYYHHPSLLTGRAACRSREDVVRLLLGITGPSRGSGSGPAPVLAASRKSSRSRGSSALSKAASAAAKATSASGKKGAAALAGPGDGTEPQQPQRKQPDDHQHEQQEGQQQQQQQQPKLRKLATSSAQEPSSPRSPRRPVSSPRGVASPRAAAAAFSPGRLQPPPAPADPVGRPGRRRAAAGAAAAVQAAAAEGAEEDEAVPLARSRGGRVLKRSAAAQVRTASALVTSACHVLAICDCRKTWTRTTNLAAFRTRCISRPATRVVQQTKVLQMRTQWMMSGRCATLWNVRCAALHWDVRIELPHA